MADTVRTSLRPSPGAQRDGGDTWRMSTVGEQPHRRCCGARSAAVRFRRRRSGGVPAGNEGRWNMTELIHALTEEIGDPDLFVGRKAE
ncbi:MAG: hypothetical protein GY856_44650, partial [bacterium]|nr:hypothetical protein [bacterium]